MKKLAVLFLALCAMSNLFAQDIILMKQNHEEIESRVIEVTDYTVEYKRYSDLEGASFMVRTVDVDTIFYENGDKQYFVLIDEEPEVQQQAEVQTQNTQYATYQEDVTNNVTRTYEIKQKGLYHSNRGPEFQCMLDMGVDFTADHVGPGFDASFGVRATDWFYIGLGLGFGSLIKTTPEYYFNTALSYETYLQLRFYIPARWNVMPFFDGAFGYQLSDIDDYHYSYLYAHGGFGIEFDWFEFSLGYKYAGFTHAGYARIGFSF